MPESPAILLCPSSELEERGRAHTFDVLQWREPTTAFAMRFEGKVVAYLNRCAHVPTEMDWQDGQFLDADKGIRHLQHPRRDVRPALGPLCLGPLRTHGPDCYQRQRARGPGLLAPDRRHPTRL